MINKKAKKDDFAEWDKEGVPQREYTDSELADFHNKIQRFWGEPRTLDQELYGGKVAQHFNFEELALAYGACRKLQHGMVEKNGESVPLYVYLYTPERYRELDTLWNQYVRFRERQDWVENKKAEELAKTEGVPF